MPVQNILMRQYRDVRKNPEAISSKKTFRVGNVNIKRGKLISGLILSLKDSLGKTFTQEELLKPNDEVLEAIFNYKKIISAKAQKPFDHESKGITLMDDSHSVKPYKEMSGVMSPIVLDSLIATCSQEGKVQPVEYMREELKDIDLIIIPYNHSWRIRLISYVVSLGLDIEVSMVNDRKTLEDEIEFLNSGREVSKRRRKAASVLTEIRISLVDCPIEPTDELVQGLEKAVSRQLRKAGLRKEVEIIVNTMKDIGRHRVTVEG